MLKIMVPATTANIGPGFDSLGMALNLYNTFYIEQAEATKVSWENKIDSIDTSKNLAYKSIMYTLKKYDRKINFHLTMGEMKIPMARGLGSSASAIVAGIFAADYLMGKQLSEEDMIETAVELEGHADNVVPAIVGGFCISLLKDDQVIVSKVNVPQSFKFIIMIPNYKLSTEKARAILPQVYPTKDVVFNISRTALLINAFNQANKSLLRMALEDAIHEPYRRDLIKEYPDILEYSYSVGALGTTISSSGPTLLSIVDDQSVFEKISKYINIKYDDWDIKLLNANKTGTIIEEI